MKQHDHSEKLAQLTLAQKQKLKALIEQKKRSNNSHLSTLKGPLSPFQHSLWTVDQINGSSTEYNIVGAIALEGRLDVVQLEQALLQTVKKHPVLRSAISVTNNEPYQEVKAINNVCLNRIDISTSAKQDDLEAVLTQESAYEFDLSDALKIRATLVKHATNNHTLILCLHHIASDGWSLNILLKDIQSFYNKDPLVTNDGISYITFAQKTQETLQATEASLKYWTNQLSSTPTTHDIPLDFPRSSTTQPKAASAVSAIDPLLWKNLQKFAQSHKISTFSLLQSAFAVFLHKIMQADEVVFGTPFANRETREVQNTVGYFVNPIVLRHAVSPELSFESVLEAHNNTLHNAYAHAQLPFNKIVEQLKPERVMGMNPIFQILFALEPARDNLISLNNLDAKTVPVVSTAKFDLNTTIFFQEDSAQIEMLYNQDIFRESTIAHYLTAFNTLLSRLIMDAQTPIEQLTWLTDAEQTKLANFEKGVGLESDQQLDCLSRFEDSVRRNPDKLAVCDVNHRYTYQEVDILSDKLAREIQEQGVDIDINTNSKIALFLPPSAHAIVAIISCFRLGVAYVPIDHKAPKARIRSILSQSGAKICITDQSGHLSEHNDIHVINISDFIRNQANQTIPSYVPVKRNKNAAAYVIFTSGTTGEPKGVVVSQSNLTDYVHGITAKINADQHWHYAVCSSLSTDLGNTSIYLSLFNNGCLHIADEKVQLEPEAFHHFISENKIDFLKLTPTHFHALTGNDIHPDVLPKQVLMFGGEAASTALLSKIAYAQLPASMRIFNHYGPTETTIGCFAGQWHQEKQLAMPLGEPLPNVLARVVDKYGKRVPINTPGELYVGGPGVATGYLNQPKLTDEKFVSDPLNSHASRFYRTGDLVKWQEDGQLVYLGRIDDQVKIRGYRIEISEIEKCLDSLAEVKTSCINIRKLANGQQVLDAYLVGSRHYALQDLSLALADQLPEYMHPSSCTMIDQLPLLPNGKINKAKLPVPAVISPSKENHELTPIEAKIINIMKDVLNVAEVHVQDNFFSIGGDSISAIQVAANAQDKQINLTTHQIFTEQTIEAICAAVEFTEPQISQDASQGQLNLLPIQREFIENGFLHGQVPQQVMLFDTVEALNESSLASIVNALYTKHDALRLSFEHSEEQGIAHFKDAWTEENVITYVDIAKDAENDINLALEQQARKLQKRHGALLDVVVFRQNTRWQKLAFLVHPLIVDALSWHILKQDISTCIQQLQKGQPLILQKLSDSIQAWSDALQHGFASGSIESNRHYWQQQVKNATERQPSKPGLSENIDVHLSQEVTSQLFEQVSNLKADLPELIISAIASAFNKHSNKRNLLVELKSHGRYPISRDCNIENTLGWFVSTYPQNIALAQEACPTQQLRAVKESIRSVPDWGLSYGLAKYANGSKDETLHYEADIAFNFIGKFSVQDDLAANAFDQSPPMIRFIGKAALTSHTSFITAYIDNNLLKLIISFNNACHTSDHMLAFAKDLLSALQHLPKLQQEQVSGHLTPSDFPLANVDEHALQQLLNTYPQIDNIYPATPMQESMLFQSAIESGAYNTQIRFTLHGTLNQAHFNQAWQSVVQRHDILRTAFVTLEELVQLVVPHNEMLFTDENIAHLSTFEQEDYIDAFCRQDKLAGYDVTQPTLMRLKVFERAPKVYEVIWSHHHAISDGWCTPQIFDEVIQAYKTLESSQALDLSPAPSYAKFIEWLEAFDKDAARAYWSERLAGLTQATALPFNPIQNTSVQGVSSHQFMIDEQVTTSLTELARSWNVTLSAILQYAWGFLLHRYSHEDKVIFGVTQSGRPAQLESAKDTVGLFINSVPTVMTFDESASTKRIVQQIHQNTALREQHGHLPLNDIKDQTDFEANSPLFNTLLVIENFNHESLFNSLFEGTSLYAANIQYNEPTNFPLTLTIIPAKDIKFDLEYQQSLFSASQIASLTRHLLELLNRIATEQSMMHQDFNFNSSTSLIPKKEATRHNECLRENSIHRLFEESARRFPEKPALFFNAEQIHYAELNAKANQFAHYLKEIAPSDTEFVALIGDKSIDFITMVLATLKAGFAFIPITSDTPIDRIKLIISDANCQLVINSEEHKSLTELNIQQVTYDAGLYQTLPTDNLDNDSADNAYAIYTSGTTGKPKGIIVTHQSYLSTIAGYADVFQLNNTSSVILQMANVNFDVFCADIARSLCFGNQLVLCTKDEVVDPQLLVNKMTNYQVTFAEFVPAVLREVSSYLHTEDLTLSSIDTIVVSSDCWYMKDQRQLAQVLADNTRIFNVYGVTEATIDSTYIELTDKTHDHYNIAPIGRPFDDTSIIIVDEHLRATPLGVVGELCIGGDSLSAGYLNRPQLNGEKYTYLADKSLGRIYRTGDLAFINFDGIIEIVGRNDHQVKLRGQRIELTEIINTINTSEKVKESVVIAHGQDPDKYLTAYIVLADQSVPHELATSEIKQLITQKLPSYMMPAEFQVIDRMPLTANKKLDRKSLPKSTLTRIPRTIEKPSTPLEEKVLQIWKKVLDQDAICVTGNFFDIGGHSLKLAQLAGQLNKCLDIKTSIKTLYQLPTVRQFCTHYQGVAASESVVDRNTLISDANISLPDCTAQLANITSPKHILLTGATGFVGQYLLRSLLAQPHLQVHCLVRGNSPKQRIIAKMKGKALWQESFNDRLHVYSSDLAQPSLGLSKHDALALAQTIDTVIHNATHMNHSAPYQFLKPTNVDATQALLELCTQQKLKQFHFISTIDVLNNACSADEATDIFALAHDPSNGYVASKWVGEMMTLNARHFGVPTTIHRLGLVSSDKYGYFEPNQWLIKLLYSCQHMGAYIQDHSVDVALTYVDETANTIAGLATRNLAGGTYHLCTSKQFNMMDVFKHHTSQMTPLSLEQWLAQITQNDDTTNGITSLITDLLQMSGQKRQETFASLLRSKQEQQPISNSKTLTLLDDLGLTLQHVTVDGLFPVVDQISQSLDDSLENKPKLA